jgi:hypothetical protein
LYYGIFIKRNCFLKFNIPKKYKLPTIKKGN